MDKDLISALPPVDGLEVVGHLTEEGGATKIGFYPISSRSEGLVTLSQASSVIAGLKDEIADLRAEWQAEYDARLAANTARRAAEARISSLEQANEALRRERITAERDALEAYRKLQTAEARASSLEEENKRLRAVVSASADALGNGAFISTEASVEFMEMLPVEIRAFSSRIGDHNG